MSDSFFKIELFHIIETRSSVRFSADKRNNAVEQRLAGWGGGHTDAHPPGGVTISETKCNHIRTEREEAGILCRVM